MGTASAASPDVSAITHLFAGVPVSDLDAAKPVG
jgi:hypothetical protein